MKAISSSSIFHLPRDRAGAGGFCGYSSSSTSYSLKIFAKKSKNNGPSSPSKDSKPPPPRITSNLKQNLQIIKFWKEYRKRKSSTPKPATSYRRKKVEKEDLPEETVTSQDPILPLVLDVDIEGASPVLLVDGYNVCGYWSKMKKDFMSGRLNIARQKLIDELVTYSAMRDVKVVVVFDALMSGLPTHKESFAGIDVVYTGESCADAWIEKEVALLRKDGCPRVRVATSDRYERDSAIGNGAFVWSCKALVAEIEDSHKELEISVQRYSSTSMQGRLLKHNLNPKVVDALKDLRNKLAAQESRRP